MSDLRENGLSRAEMIGRIVVVIVTALGIGRLADPWRRRYFQWVMASIPDKGLAHVGLYLGHVILITAMLLYAWAVKKDRPYFTGMFRGSPRRNALYGVLGALTGFVLMGICIFAASAHGDIVIRASSDVQAPILLLALPVVLIQASTEEVESRGFLFGRMKSEGIPVMLAAGISAFYFAYIHLNNEGFGILPLLSIFVVGFQLALSCHYFGTIWFACGMHTLWNYTQDFIFGLPDSGNPAAVSIFNTTVNGSSFFYNRTFGIEGSAMAILVNLIGCGVLFLVGRRIRGRR